jgi:methionyl-tRNA formyltransferase
MHGDDITGATTFELVAAMDAGPVYGVVTEAIRPADTSGDLLGRLAESGSALLVATLDAIEDGTVRAEPQPDEGVSFAPKLNPPDARVDWKLPAHLIDRTVRACTPDPGAWTTYDGGRVKLWPFVLPAKGIPGAAVSNEAVPSESVPSESVPGELAGLAPGELHVGRGTVHVGTGSGPVRLGDVQPPGKRRMPAADWARGLRTGPGERPGFE